MNQFKLLLALLIISLVIVQQKTKFKQKTTGQTGAGGTKDV